MATSIISAIIVGLSLSAGGLMLADDPLLALIFSDQNPHNPLISIVVRGFFFLLVPFTFISAILLLLLYVAVPHEPTAGQLAKATQVMALCLLLVEVPLVISMVVYDAIVPDAVKAGVIGIAAVIISIPFNQAGGTVQAFVTLCISTSALLVIDQNGDNPLFHLLLFCNFNLGAFQLFLHMSMFQLAHHMRF